ncbi:hypothetical protein AB6N01_10035 [Alcaligenes nematophilus]|uniref:Uncharacterized protein n=3 Tax=Alcaligenes TaxID=507 RepID=A0ABY7N0J5_ALCFA|nr:MULTISPECIES: hypothetical protein [Alcaligenes]ARP54936.1 hypothetical protein ALFP_3049 [Alcaligenes faecalis]AYN21977.1 hypothetical protein D3M96_16435 [Alcaligenes aquatilis]MCX5565773.1 hypothetical protein [Alcaligenes phenolicus]WBM37586.1 hypothetical protein M2J83_17565 [Alcaligenes faecalis]
MQVDQFVEQFRRALADADPRATVTARVRLLLPIIEQRLANGSSYAAIVEDLNATGIEISQTVFANALWRLRQPKKPRTSTTAVPILTQPSHSVAAPPITSTTPVQAPALRTEAVQGRPNAIDSPADLRRIHDMDIDLDALREEGRAMRAKPKSS